MPLLQAADSILLCVDFQTRLMPAIHDADTLIGNAQRLRRGAELLDVPLLFTEQNPKGLGGTVADLAPDPSRTFVKMSFNACRGTDLLARLPAGKTVLVTGAEAHVCVLQTVFGLLAAGRRVFVAIDAIGSRRPESRAAAIDRMMKEGAGMVTTEMVLFEWLESAEHPRFKDVIALVK
ncbi:isochorismatase family protein [Dongia sp.]|uniref:isochorismatase family protein n=1 Tax=Dongia sp. TaxID=1977262 RepID=UPI0035B428B0